MSAESKTPAACHVCGAVGPSRARGYAAKLGWVRQRNGWACPACVAAESRRLRTAADAWREEAGAPQHESTPERDESSEEPRRRTARLPPTIAAMMLLAGLGFAPLGERGDA